jgi:hypothetical protein
MKRRDFLAGSTASALVATTGKAFAQSGPLTKIIFPFAAGGGGDALCRLLAQHIGPLLDRSIIVENRTGGDGLIGIKAVKGANPDGTTILVTTGPTMYLLPMVETTPSFDAAKDFVPVSQLTRFEFCVFVGTAVPAEVKDFKQFVAWLKANPDQATFGVPSNGTIPHFTGSRALARWIFCCNHFISGSRMKFDNVTSAALTSFCCSDWACAAVAAKPSATAATTAVDINFFNNVLMVFPLVVTARGAASLYGVVAGQRNSSIPEPVTRTRSPMRSPGAAVCWIVA